ncbi:hypothetical protein EI94DRAFT_863204, partial [Lactarius quietus]
ENILTSSPGAQQEFETTDKYRGKRTIRNWGKPCIWLNNKDPRDGLPEWKLDWLNANCVVVHLTHPLYSVEPEEEEAKENQVQPIPASPTPAPPTAPQIRWYIDEAAEQLGSEGYQGGQVEFLEEIAAHTKFLHRRAAFREEDTFQLDDLMWESTWDGYIREVQNFLDGG